jgi:hypothetical protein
VVKSVRRYRNANRNTTIEYRHGEATQSRRELLFIDRVPSRPDTLEVLVQALGRCERVHRARFEAMPGQIFVAKPGLNQRQL